MPNTPIEHRLGYDFFARHVANVAHDLIGKILVWNGIHVIITETEAYRGTDDEASHAFKGPTPRATIMFENPGLTYVYLIYGMHHCLNIVAEPEHSGAAVLIRAIQDITTHKIISGPGNVCKFLNITRHDNGIDVLNDPLYKVLNTSTTPRIHATPRIGITKNKDILWRFIM